MATHSSAIALEVASYTTEKTKISEAAKRRAQLVINDSSTDPRWRAIIRYGLETNDPWLPDLVRRADARERIVETTDFSPVTEAAECNADEERIKALAEIICRASHESAAALLVLMGTVENSMQPKILANGAKHYVFTRCGELNINGMVDAQIAVLEDELFGCDSV